MHDSDLRDSRRRKPRLVREGSAAFDKHLALIEQVRAAGLDEIDERQLVFLRDLLRAQRLFQSHRRDGATLDGAVARQDQRALAGNDADADDGASAHDSGRAIVVVHAKARKRGEFEKRRSMVEKARDALPGQNLASFGKLFGLLRRMRDYGSLKAAEFFHLREKLRGIGLEGLRIAVRIREAITGMGGNLRSTS